MIGYILNFECISLFIPNKIFESNFGYEETRLKTISIFDGNSNVIIFDNIKGVHIAHT